MKMKSPIRVDEKSRFATQAELRAAIQSLSDAERTKLEKLAKSRCARLGTQNWAELLNEAIVRALSNQRRWPRNVSLIAFFAEVMRSISSDWARQSARMTYLPSDDNTLSADDPRPDQTAVARILLGRIEAEFANDADVRGLLTGLFAGETAPETVLRLGISHHQYDAARKRLNRAVNKLLDSREND